MIGNINNSIDGLDTDNVTIITIGAHGYSIKNKIIKNLPLTVITNADIGNVAITSDYTSEFFIHNNQFYQPLTIKDINETINTRNIKLIGSKSTQYNTIVYNTGTSMHDFFLSTGYINKYINEDCTTELTDKIINNAKKLFLSELNKNEDIDLWTGCNAIDNYNLFDICDKIKLLINSNLPDQVPSNKASLTCLPDQVISDKTKKNKEYILEYTREPMILRILFILMVCNHYLISKKYDYDEFSIFYNESQNFIDFIKILKHDSNKINNLVKHYYDNILKINNLVLNIDLYECFKDKKVISYFKSLMSRLSCESFSQNEFTRNTIDEINNKINTVGIKMSEIIVLAKQLEEKINQNRYSSKGSHYSSKESESHSRAYHKVIIVSIFCQALRSVKEIIKSNLISFGKIKHKIIPPYTITSSNSSCKIIKYLYKLSIQQNLPIISSINFLDLLLNDFNFLEYITNDKFKKYKEQLLNVQHLKNIETNSKHNIIFNYSVNRIKKFVEDLINLINGRKLNSLNNLGIIYIFSVFFEYGNKNTNIMDKLNIGHINNFASDKSDENIFNVFNNFLSLLYLEYRLTHKIYLTITEIKRIKLLNKSHNFKRIKTKNVVLENVIDINNIFLRIVKRNIEIYEAVLSVYH